LRKEVSWSSAPPGCGNRKWQQPGGPAEAHRWLRDHPPSVGPDVHGAPGLIREIEIDVAVVLGDANVDRSFGAVKLRLRLEQIECGV